MTGSLEGLILDLDDVDLTVYEALKHEISDPLSYREELTDHFMSDPDTHGARLPFPSGTDFRFRRGECTVLSGANYTGKSSLIMQCCLHWLRGNSSETEKILLVSPEMSPMQSLARIVRQVTAKIPNQVTEQDVGAVLAFLQGRFWVYDALGQVTVSDLNNVIRYSCAELGVTHAVVDNLSVLQLDGADTNRAQSDLMTRFVATSRSSNCHITLVAHNRKPAPGEKPGDRFAISGSAALSNLADNVVIITRNEKKSEMLEDMSLSMDERSEIEAQSDTKFIVSKQRHGKAWIGTVKLYYYPFSMRWHEQRRAPDLAYSEIETLAEIGDASNSRGYQHG